jgi:hypothetical protein
VKMLLGSAAAWPLAARAQQPAMPVIGVLDARSPGTTENSPRAFREGLKDTGYIAGENVALEYRWAENQMDRLPTLAAELARRRVTLIAAIGSAMSFRRSSSRRGLRMMIRFTSCARHWHPDGHGFCAQPELSGCVSGRLSVAATGASSAFWRNASHYH